MLSIDRSSPVPIYMQIEQLFESLIFEQCLAAHEVLPGAVTLSEQLKVSPLTVKKAYVHLQERGLIYSIAGKGTFVAQMKDRPFVAVVVHNESLIEATPRTEVPLMLQGVREELIAQRHRPQMLIDMNPRFLHPAPIGTSVMEAVRRGRVSGIVLMWHYGSEELFTLAKERRIPIVGYGIELPKGIARVSARNDEMLGLSMRNLKSRGVEQVGVMWLDRSKPPAVLARWVRHLQELIHQHGLTTRPEWLLGIPEANEWESYHAFNHLCDLPDRPGGLVMLDEFLGRGVLMAAQSRGIVVPQDMDMVVASYEDSGFQFPGSWSRCEVNLRQCGERTVQTLCDLMDGGSVAENIQIQFAWHGGVEGADDPIVGKFRDGRQILAGEGEGILSNSNKSIRPMFGRTFSKESVR